MRVRALAVLSIAIVLTTASTRAQPKANVVCGSRDAQCDIRRRIATAEQYLATRPGTIGFVLRDRETGVKYRNANAGTLIWTASTIKLAMVADLLTRERSGALRRTRSGVQRELHSLRNAECAPSAGIRRCVRGSMLASPFSLASLVIAASRGTLR